LGTPVENRALPENRRNHTALEVGYHYDPEEWVHFFVELDLPARER
jgi:hypothetical protein